MLVNAGELDKRIGIYLKPELDKDGHLPDDAEPKLARACWAKFTQISGTELFRNNADMGEAKVRFLIRYTKTPIDRKMFVRYRETDYDILYVNGYGDTREYLELWCRWTGEGTEGDTHEAEPP